jgi:dTDP-4-amino-4,6-dideoxygalactose transaminase
MIQVFKPMIRTSEILPKLEEIFSSGWIGLGPRTKIFEEKISNFLNCGNFIATNSCTSSLHLAVRCLNLPKGSKILTTPITFVSTNSAILYENHSPVFYDIDPDTGNADPLSIERMISNHPDIKAIILAHIGGYSCDMEKINEIAKKNKIQVIEDCAHSFGGKYKGKMIGDTDNLCVWSFQAVKNLPVGDGGGISTKNDEIASRIRKLIWLGIDKNTVERSNLDSKKQSYNWDYEVVDIGYKYHMTDIMATIGLVQFEYLESDNQRRRLIAERYRNEITNPKCKKPDYKEDRESSYHFYPLFFENRDEVYKKLTDNMIYPGMHYKKNDRYIIFRNFEKDKLNGADRFERSELTLPIHLHLTDEDVTKIIDIVNNA